MRQRNNLLTSALVILIILSSYGFHSEASVWSKISDGVNEAAVNCVAANPQDAKRIYAGTSKTLYQSINSGQSFQPIENLQTSLTQVNYIYISDSSDNLVFAATDSGLFSSVDQGNQWQKIYESYDERYRSCLSVIEKGGVIYLGTSGGLFYKSAVNQRWFKEAGISGVKEVYRLGKDSRYIYILTSSDLYRYGGEPSKIEKIFSFGFDAHQGNDDESLNIRRLKDLCVVGKGKSKIYLATKQGIFKSENHGHKWVRLPSNGLPLADVTTITVREDEPHAIYVGTRRGIYLLKGDLWVSVYQGLETNDVNFLAHDGEGKIYAATSRGLFVTQIESVSNASHPTTQSNSINPSNSANSLTYSQIIQQFDHEPNISEIHKIATSYAEVHPDKIKDWRRRAYKRAWLPDLSIGLDQDKNKTLSDSLWGSYTSGGQHYVGPDDKTAYDNLGWDVSLSWDLADLVWSTDQTTIDSRSKYTVELREDILDQVTRLYFERRRIQIELANAVDLPSKAEVDKRMRIDELTALLDAFTGGEFSRRIATSHQPSAVSFQIKDKQK